MFNGGQKTSKPCRSTDAAASTAADDDQPRRLFRQRKVLDTLRLYLELSSDFLRDMHDNRLITDDEVDSLKVKTLNEIDKLLDVNRSYCTYNYKSSSKHACIKDTSRLSWPVNRNELLQMLVKKKWTAASFDTFCAILKRTQTSQLNQLLAEKLRTSEFDAAESTDEPHREIRINAFDPQFVASDSDDDTRQDSSYSSSGLKDDSLDSLLEPLALTDRCSVRVMIRDRDERLAKLMKKNERLQHELTRKEHELEDSRIKNQLMEHHMADWLAGLHVPCTDQNDATLQQSLDAVTDFLGHQTERIAQLRQDVEELKGARRELEKKLSVAERRCEALTGQLEEAREERNAGRRGAVQLERELMELRDELEKIGGGGGAAPASQDEVPDTERTSDGKTSSHHHKLSKNGSKVKHSKPHGNTADEDAEKQQQQQLNKAVVELKKAGRRGSDPAVMARVRHDSSGFGDGKKTTTVTGGSTAATAAAAAPTSSRLVTRRASVSTETATKHRVHNK